MDNSNFFQLAISKRIIKDSLEYKSLTDTKKLDSLYNLTRYHRKTIKDIAFHSQERIYNIPIIDLAIYHQEKATIVSDGSLVVNGHYFQSTPNKKGIEKLYQYVQQLSLKTIKNKQDIKSLFKKIYFSYFSMASKRKKKKLENEKIAKLLFFETAYDNMYHFIFQYYPSLLALIEYCKNHQLDYYIIFPSKYNRGFRSKYFYDGFINEIIKIEKIDKEKIIFLDYQNYNVNNIYYTNFPSENPKIQFKAIEKLKFFLYNRQNISNIMRGGGHRIYISRRKATRRHLVNENEIKKILECEYGFKTYCMEDYNLKEKIILMAQAEVVVSIDGTSMINSIFSMQKHVKAIAIRLYDFTEAVNIAIAPFKHVEYLPIVATLAKEKYEGYEGIWYTSDLYLDPEILRKKLKDYLVYPKSTI